MIRLATRGSALALRQARLVADLLHDDVELVEVRTSGDARRAVGDKSRWVKEIEAALLDGRADLAVHSAKDVPGVLPDGLAIVGVPARGDARDALCGGDEGGLDGLPEGAVVGTSALRRRAQVLAARPDLDVRDLRGNVDTRLRRLADGDFDAIVLAAAGLDRLGRLDEASSVIDADALTPAPGQGCLALEARVDDDRAASLAGAVTDAAALIAFTAERAVVDTLEATCDTPVGAHAELVEDGALRVSAFAGLPDGSTWVRDSLEGDASEPAALGRAVAERMLLAGAGDVLSDAAAT